MENMSTLKALISWALPVIIKSIIRLDDDSYENGKQTPSLTRDSKQSRKMVIRSWVCSKNKFLSVFKASQGKQHEIQQIPANQLENNFGPFSVASFSIVRRIFVVVTGKNEQRGEKENDDDDVGWQEENVSRMKGKEVFCYMNNTSLLTTDRKEGKGKEEMHDMSLREGLVQRILSHDCLVMSPWVSRQRHDAA